jgi:hypothetical protein
VPPRFHFVARNLARDWPDIETLREVDIDRSPGRFRGGVNNWIVQSYLRLREALERKGIDSSLDDSLRSDAINIAHRDSLSRMSTAYGRHRIVGIRADRPPVRVSEWEIVQNRLAASSAGRRYVPLWPQPGLTRRMPSRGATIRRIGYFGRTSACPEWLFAPAFRRELQAIGVDLCIAERAWHDYAHVDLVLSCRVESHVMLRQKPASKLVNAWLAGVPLLATREPAFEALRRSSLDYLPIGGPRDVIETIRRLRAHPERYHAIVANGANRAREFTVAATRARWLDFLLGEVLTDVARGAGVPHTALARLLHQKCEGRWFKLRAGAEVGILRLASHVRDARYARRTRESTRETLAVEA